MANHITPGAGADAVETVARIRAEGELTMEQAALLLPPMKNRRSVKPGTVADYCVRGRRGVKLDGYRGPSGWITSEAAIVRFLAALHDLGQKEDARLLTAAAVRRREEADRLRAAMVPAGPDGELTPGQKAALELMRRK